MTNYTELKNKVKELRATQKSFENAVNQTESDKENALRYKTWADGLNWELNAWNKQYKAYQKSITKN